VASPAWSGGCAAAPTHASAAELLGDFNRPGGIATSQADRIAAVDRQAAAISSPPQLIQRSAVTGPPAIATARRLGPVVVDNFELAVLPLQQAVSSGSCKPPSTCWTSNTPSVCRPTCCLPVYSTWWSCWPGWRRR